jgi:hypothetical protein
MHLTAPVLPESFDQQHILPTFKCRHLPPQSVLSRFGNSSEVLQSLGDRFRTVVIPQDNPVGVSILIGAVHDASRVHRSWSAVEDQPRCELYYRHTCANTNA